MLLGKTGAGKTTLIQALQQKSIEYKKTQSLEFFDGILDTPGEYLERKNYYRALTVSAVDYDTIIFLQPADEEMNFYPAGFSNLFMEKEVVGVITKIDTEDADTKLAEMILLDAGCTRIFKVSSITREGIEELREFINN